MIIKVTNVTGFYEAFVSMFMSKRTWTHELDRKIRVICYNVVTKDGKINYPAQAGAVIASTDKYRELLAVLEDNLLRTDFAQCTVNEMLKIIEAVAAYIPSSTNKAEACDISLYDHSRLTAAIAVAMEQYFTAIEITDYKAYCSGSKNAEFRAMEAFLLIEADMSGIQDFIYTIPSKGALKSLRGRPFYLEMLIEHIGNNHNIKISKFEERLIGDRFKLQLLEFFDIPPSDLLPNLNRIIQKS